MNQPFSFNLIDEPWLPCARPDGGQELLGLRRALAEAHRLRELGGESPLVVVALHRLLLALLHRVFGPADIEAWAALWRGGAFDAAALDAYFAQWHDRFDLFHPTRPFYQAADPRVKPKSVLTLILDMSSAGIFEHSETDRVTLSPAQAARALITAETFSIAGLSGLEQKFTDCTVTRGVHFLVEGDSLFETLALNLLPYPDEGVMPSSSDDRPVWEMDDPFRPARSVPLGYLDYLTWMNRRILLLPEMGDEGPVVRQFTWAPALRLAAEVLDPFKHYRIDPDPKTGGPKLLRFHEERALWRDSAALLSLHQSRRPDAKTRPPHPFAWLYTLYDDDPELFGRRPLYRFRAAGMASDQARVFFYRDERMPLPLAYLESEEHVSRLKEATDRAEAAARQLWGACRTLATFVIKPDADAEGAKPPVREDLDRLTASWAAERHYWAALELPFRQLLVALPDDPAAATAAWHEATRRAARRALDQTIDLAGDDGRALKAAVRARGQLAYGLKQVYALTKQEVSQ